MIKIFVEGKSDEIFIKAYIQFLNNDGVAKPFEIVNLGGKDKIRKGKKAKPKNVAALQKVYQQFDENTENGGINLIIFDADRDFKKRQKEINALKETANIDFDLFLFPNNQSQGDLEVLLENIVNPQHRQLLDFFDTYTNSIQSLLDKNAQLPYAIPDRKTKIYAYITSFKRSEEDNELLKKGNYFYDNPIFWDLKASYLNRLKIFLQKYF